jgi:hypothetical protein
MIFAWLSARGFLGLAKWIWVAIAVVVMIGAVVWL